LEIQEGNAMTRKEKELIAAKLGMTLEKYNKVLQEKGESDPKLDRLGMTVESFKDIVLPQD